MQKECSSEAFELRAWDINTEWNDILLQCKTLMSKLSSVASYEADTQTAHHTRHFSSQPVVKPRGVSVINKQKNFSSRLSTHLTHILYTIWKLTILSELKLKIRFQKWTTLTSAANKKPSSLPVNSGLHQMRETTTSCQSKPGRRSSS